MDTNLRVAERGSVRGKYKHHPLSFKRAVVEEMFWLRNYPTVESLGRWVV